MTRYKVEVEGTEGSTTFSADTRTPHIAAGSACTRYEGKVEAVTVTKGAEVVLKLEK